MLKIGTQIFSGVRALRGIRTARRNGDRWEILDALAHAAVFVTGTVLLVRALRNDKAEASQEQKEAAT